MCIYILNETINNSLKLLLRGIEKLNTFHLIRL